MVPFVAFDGGSMVDRRCCVLRRRLGLRLPWLLWRLLTVVGAPLSMLVCRFRCWRAFILVGRFLLVAGLGVGRWARPGLLFGGCWSLGSVVARLGGPWAR